MRNPLSILFLLLWLFLGFFYWNSSTECCLGTSEAEAAISEAAISEGAAPVVEEVELKGPLLFESNKENPITGDGWEAMRDRILEESGSDKLVEITGMYRANEVNNTEYENLGLARANKIRILLPELPDERVRELSIIKNDSTNTSPFEAVDFAYKVNNQSIKEVEDKTRIYFPYSSTEKLDDATVEAYLNDVAERVIKSGETVKLVGHTDSISSSSFNKRLGLKRANVVANYLISKGVPAEQISTSSAGESNPIADNANEAGRAENRRTELQIIK